MMVLATALALGIRDIGPWVFFINAAMIAPALPLSWLRWFWWRLNVWGEVFGILISVPLAAGVWFGLGWKSRPVWQPTLLLLGVGLGGSVLISLLTAPESRETLRRFYRQIRPPGAWGPIRRELEAEGLADATLRRRELAWDLCAAACGIVFCFAITWSFFTAVMLRWTESAALALVGAVSGWAYYTCWLRSQAVSAERAEASPGIAVTAGPVPAVVTATGTGVTP
jgi:SSS family solute:Na+ symporter